MTSYGEWKGDTYKVNRTINYKGNKLVDENSYNNIDRLMSHLDRELLILMCYDSESLAKQYEENSNKPENFANRDEYIYYANYYKSLSQHLQRDFHSKRSWFENAYVFKNGKNNEVLLSKEARNIMNFDLANAIEDYINGRGRREYAAINEDLNRVKQNNSNNLHRVRICNVISAKLSDMWNNRKEVIEQKFNQQQQQQQPLQQKVENDSSMDLIPNYEEEEEEEEDDEEKEEKMNQSQQEQNQKINKNIEINMSNNVSNEIDNIAQKMFSKSKQEILNEITRTKESSFLNNSSETAQMIYYFIFKMVSDLKTKVDSLYQEGVFNSVNEAAMYLCVFIEKSIKIIRTIFRSINENRDKPSLAKEEFIVKMYLDWFTMLKYQLYRKFMLDPTFYIFELRLRTMLDYVRKSSETFLERLEQMMKTKFN